MWTSHSGKSSLWSPSMIYISDINNVICYKLWLSINESMLCPLPGIHGNWTHTPLGWPQRLMWGLFGRTFLPWVRYIFIVVAWMLWKSYFFHDHQNWRSDDKTDPLIARWCSRRLHLKGWKVSLLFIITCWSKQYGFNLVRHPKEEKFSPAEIRTRDRPLQMVLN